MSVKPGRENRSAIFRHAWCAFEDFSQLRRRRRRQRREELWHSISHHLRHVIWRTSQELPRRERRYVRRSDH